jgi:DNA-binding HxlR family transcriptional regulator
LELVEAHTKAVVFGHKEGRAMSSKSYGMICALSKACEIVEPRWTLPILDQLWSGYSRFNDIRRAVGNISPAVLSKRLSDMEKAGLIERLEDRSRRTVDYVRTQKAIELEPVMNALAIWAQRNIDAEVALGNSAVSTHMWHFGRNLKTAEFPSHRVVLRFHFADEKGPYPTYWFVVEPGRSVEMCVMVPDFDIDLYVETSNAALLAIGMGRSTVARETDAGRLFATGDPRLLRTMNRWLPRSVYADVDGIRMLPAAQ